MSLSSVKYGNVKCIIGEIIPRGVRPLHIRKDKECYFTVCDNGDVYCSRNEEYYDQA
ncbi:hypothetical protein LCGC14_1305790 [marine sediment metagenome]|uniref:Uncharacterized protein n=1 Tax=marine sediment metagenome TaxID=412755 RepID=A0A0F9L8R2_9ZZZZ